MATNRQLEPIKNLFIPLSLGVWTDPDVEYSYIEGLGVGTWAGTAFATIYAPESGLFLPQPENSWIIRVEAKDHTREWFGISPVDDLISSSNRSIEGGTKVGTSNGPLKMALWITIRDSGEKTTFDPAKSLVFFKARFADIQSTNKENAKRNEPKNPLERAPAEHNRSSISKKEQSSSSNSDSKDSDPKDFFDPNRKFTAGQAIVLMAGSLILGGAVVWAAK